jgi:hypothetical protein
MLLVWQGRLSVPIELNHFSSLCFCKRVGLREFSSNRWLCDVVKFMVCVSIPVLPVVVMEVVPMKERS